MILRCWGCPAEVRYYFILLVLHSRPPTLCGVLYLVQPCDSGDTSQIADCRNRKSCERTWFSLGKLFGCHNSTQRMNPLTSSCVQTTTTETRMGYSTLHTKQWICEAGRKVPLFSKQSHWLVLPILYFCSHGSLHIWSAPDVLGVIYRLTPNSQTASPRLWRSISGNRSAQSIRSLHGLGRKRWRRSIWL